LEAEADSEEGYPQSPQLAQDLPWLHLPEQRLDCHSGAVQAHLPGPEQGLGDGALRHVRATVRAEIGPFAEGTNQALRRLLA
jgi:hypothetical protein